MTHSTRTEPGIVIVAGMPRAATTFLYHTLGRHPKAWIPPRKELEFFSLNHTRGDSWYRSFFEGAEGGQIGFDISPIYFMVPEVPERIRAFDANAKVVLLVRDPVEFVISFFHNRRGVTRENLDFAEFLAGHRYTKDGQTIEFVFEDGIVRDAIERFRSVFGPNLLLCDYASVKADPLPVLKAIEAFAGLPSHFNDRNFENVRVNASDQRNIVWLNHLMHQRWFADLVVRFVPKKLILRARYWVQTRRRAGTGEEGATGPGDQDHALAAERLAGDRRYVRELFAESGSLLGTGEPFRTDVAPRS
jgi:hypothetical protein